MASRLLFTAIPSVASGSFPEIVSRVAEAVAGMDLLWRVTLTEFARWWQWRGRRKWSLLSRGEGRYSIQFEDWDATYPLALEVVRGESHGLAADLGPRGSR